MVTLLLSSPYSAIDIARNNCFTLLTTHEVIYDWVDGAVVIR